MTAIKRQNRNKNGLMYNNHFFNSLLNDDLFNLILNEPTSTPQYDLIENDNELIVNFMLPGFEKENISIDIKDNELIIEGERNENDNLNYKCKGSFFGKFKRLFLLPENINQNKIDATFNDGVLSITIPKEEEANYNKKIKIN